MTPLKTLQYYYDVDPESVLFPVRLRHWHKEKFWDFPATRVLKEELEEGKRKFYASIAEDIIIEL